MVQQPLVDLDLLIIEVWGSQTPLDKGLVNRRGLNLPTHDIRKKPTSIPLAGFEPAIPGSDRPQTHDLDRAANGTGCLVPVHK
jgi:hypothetical protein